MVPRVTLISGISLAVTLALGGASPAVAQKASPARPETARSEPRRPDPALKAAAERVAGALQLSSADGERTCALTLKAEPSGPGFALDFDRAACVPVAFTAQVQAWLPDPSGSIRLTDRDGRTVAEFTEATGGSYEALREGDGVYFLGPPSAAEGVDVPVEELLGEWTLARGTPAVACRWTLTDRRAGKDTLALELGRGCDSGLTQFAPASWRVEGGDVLVFSAAGAPAIRFARQEDGSWARVPERGRPLTMSRP